MQNHTTGPSKGHEQAAVVTRHSFFIDFSAVTGTAVKLISFVASAAQPTLLSAKSAVVTAFDGALKSVLSTSMTGANNDITLTAVTAGAAGNDITIALIDPAGNDAVLDITVTGTDIVVDLATDGSGNITTTASQLIAALNADAAVAALVVATLKGSDTGATAVTALTETHLASGADTGMTAAIAVGSNGTGYTNLINGVNASATAGTIAAGSELMIVADTDIYVKPTYTGNASMTVGRLLVTIEAVQHTVV